MTDINNIVGDLSPKSASGGGQGTTVDQVQHEAPSFQHHGSQASLGTIGDDQAYSSPPPVGQNQTWRPVQPIAISAGLSPSEVEIRRAHEARYQQKVGKLREALIADHESWSPLLPEAPEQVFTADGSLDICSPSLEPAEEYLRNLDELYLSPPAEKVGLDAVNPFPPRFHPVTSPQWEPLEDELSLDQHPVESGSSDLSQGCLPFELSPPEPFEPGSDASTPVSPLVLPPPMEQQLETKHPQPVSPLTSLAHMEQPSTDHRREMPEEDPVPRIYSSSTMGTALVELLEQSYDAQPMSNYETFQSRLPPIQKEQSPFEIFRKAIGATKRIHEIIKENQTGTQSTAAKLSTTRGRRGPKAAGRRSRRNREAGTTTANSSQSVQLRQSVAPSNPQDSESISGSSEKSQLSEQFEALERGGDKKRPRPGSGLFKPGIIADLSDGHRRRRRELNDSEDKENGDCD